ncbi:FHA domain-containing protein [Lyngbya confervoides]|uniref:FHA domain-containing protein n=1 Tax=Lyngbya confervoides BDU141951 TaxID=1574623 RepID=A0ABD4T0Q4_9CYAN|nr:FHA domain-containing protein [Lyngbya confervoides]MCM1981882.1 FHA domain-containing protein [Lyngbya confervoides BDU141951]
MNQQTAKIDVIRAGILQQSLPLSQSYITLGRAPDNTLCLSDDLSVSRYHAQIAWTNNDYVITDVGSSDGTYVNGQRLPPQVPHRLSHGDIVRMGTEFEIKFSAQLAPSAGPVNQSGGRDQQYKTILGADINFRAQAAPVPAQELNLQGKNQFTIGRDPSNEMIIDHPSVSRFHSQIRFENGVYTLYDLNSTNGTYVNGQQVLGQRRLVVGDNIRIGPTSLVFQLNQTLLRTNEEGNLRVDALNLNKQIRKDLNLLQNISLSILPREFVAIAGVSGGGKSTLMDSLTGFRPATSGNVYVNGIDLYRNFNAYRAEIGYVPQRDIVHMELTVEQALDFAAQLRMPADTTRVERRKRVDEVLRELNLTHRRELPIFSLSGGQLKRVSIGVELLTKPSLFFLDEATSGLDPGTESELMQLLRELADQGRTILLITHATDNVMLCDQVIFMARGGNLAYYGPPQEALAYFGVQRFNEIYRKVENELSPEEWKQRYLQSQQFQNYVVARQQVIQGAVGSHGGRGAGRNQPLPGARVRRISSLRQFIILSKRNLAILMRDRIGLALMLAVAPLLGLLDFVAWPPVLFTQAEEGNPSLAISMLFTMVLIAVMVGSLATMREIVKEIDIYKRERIIGLQILPYVMSKVWVALLLALYQAFIFVLFKALAVDIPSDTTTLVSLYITMALATVGGMLMGLLGSAVSPNQSVAPMIVLVFIVPQILFGGGVLPVNTFGPAGQTLNNLALTKWPFEALMTITEFGTDVAEDSCWSLPREERRDLKNDEKENCQCLGPNLFKGCKFPGIEQFYVPEIDQDPPEKPVSPTNPQELEAYEAQLNEWSEELSNYQIAYNGAIAEAEGNIDGLYDKFGQAFKVEVTGHWIVLTIYNLIVFGLILLVQKLKDIL